MALGKIKFTSLTQFTHNQPEKIGVLITNLGTPAAPTGKALKPYLKQFLSDPRVVEFPRLLWWLILNGIILNVRPKKSAKAYASIWTEDGSPLASHTKAQAEKLQASLSDQDILVDWAMRYGQPSIENAIQRMLDKGVRKLLVLPLYPQYSAATTASTFDALAADFTLRRWIPDLRFINNYCDRPEYIQALADSIRAHWNKHGKSEKLVLSYHGVPLKYLHQGDPYHCQCLKTSRLVAENLSLQEGDYLTTFQSRFGKEEWLKPYTDKTLQQLPKDGIKSVDVICPGFSADCLETIEEIGEENKHYFLDAGGEKYHYIPALNADDTHINMLCSLIRDNIQGWHINAEDPELREQRAKACPHNQN